VVGNAAAGVADGNVDPGAGHHVSQRRLCRVQEGQALQGNGQVAAVRHGVTRVHSQVGDDLLHPRGIGVGQQRLRRTGEVKGDVLWQRALQQADRFLEESDQVERQQLQRGAPAEVENLVDQGGGLLGLFLDNVHALLHLWREGLVKLRAARIKRDHRHDVVEVVGDAGGELPDRCQTVLLLGAFLDLALVGHVADDEDVAADRLAAAHRAGDDLVVRSLAADFMARSRRRLDQQLLQAVAAQAGELIAGGDARQLLQELLRSRICQADKTVLGEHYHAVGYRLDELLHDAGLLLDAPQKLLAVGLGALADDGAGDDLADHAQPLDDVGRPLARAPQRLDEDLPAEGALQLDADDHGSLATPAGGPLALWLPRFRQLLGAIDDKSAVTIQI